MEYLTKLRAYASILRPKNLLIIVFTMSVLQYGVIYPLTSGHTALSWPVFVIFVLATLILAGSANVINDIFDHEADLINKPDKTYIGTVLSLRAAYQYYFILLISGLVLSIYVGWASHQWYNLWIYPLAAWGLHQYSKSWKAKALIGNGIVSLFVAWVWGILFYAQLAVENPDIPQASSDILTELCYVYFFFAFLINLIREMVKDLEDLEGDKLMGMKTLPIQAGVLKTKYYILGLASFFILIFLGWLFTSELTNQYEIRFYHLVFIVMPLVLSMTNLMKAHEKKNYSFISTLLKLIMVFALAGLLIISKKFSWL